ncbi:MAG: HAMP domain-containing histidine kinase [Oscillospiraceae bacterium]|jgi:signal transduction histidine kinase|nr:HAMP domain-containing histidine kinase [Oscillospiraceae bacterium]
MLMLIIPISASVLIAYTILFIFTGGSEKPVEQSYPRALEIMTRFHHSADLDQMIGEAESFNALFDGKDVLIAVAHEGQFVYPSDVEARLSDHKAILPVLLTEGVTGNISMNNLRVTVGQTGEYRMFLFDLSYRLTDTQIFGRPLAFQVFLIFAGLLLIVVITNRVLTRLLTRSITTPLGILVDGVHQLRDGNLAYRIEYKKNDEFRQVCEDFNDMAAYLQRMIDRQQRDERSRKELLAGISHDLRTPLTSIKAYVEGLLDGVAEDLPTQLKYLKTIRQKAEDIDGLVDKLFLFSKLEMDDYPFRFEDMDIGQELERVVAEYAEEYGNKGLTIVLESLPENVLIHTDPVQLRSAMLNIIENSARYKNKPEGQICIDCRDKTDTIDIAMTDDGPGVDPDSLPLLFDVFYRSDPSRQNPNKGSGLGLAITRRIIERMGGSIKAENVAAGGLRITLTVPKDPVRPEEETHEADTHY